MAEALCRQHIQNTEDTNLQDWCIGSAGCWAYPDMPATEKAVIAVDKYNTDLSNHSARSVSASLLEDYRLVLCMEDSHVSFIKRHFPEAADRVFLFSEMINEKFEVDDPVGKSQSAYDGSANAIYSIIKNGWKKIVVLSFDRFAC